jgi:hypothetical protein
MTVLFFRPRLYAILDAEGTRVTFWQVTKCLLGAACLAMGLFKKEFIPLGWTTGLIWGNDKNARIPRSVAGPFYVVLGALMLYWGMSGK